MSLNLDTLVLAMTEAGRTLAGGVWTTIEAYAVPELRTIAQQIVAIADHAEDYTLEGAKALLALQVDAAVAVIAAATAVTLVQARQAIAEILGAVRDLVNQALPIPLL